MTDTDRQTASAWRDAADPGEPDRDLAAAAAGPPSAAARAALEEVRLLGQPPLGDYLDFVERQVIGGAAMPPRQLCDEWRAANDYYGELEATEAGLADTVDCHDLDPALDPLVEAVRADPCFQNTFAHLPASFGMVELDKLVVYQPSITRSWAADVARRLGPTPDADTVFRYCHQMHPAPPPLTVEEVDDDRFVFSSPATHLSFHEAVLLPPGRVPGYTSYGPVAGIVGLVVGFRGNFLNVIRADDRILLNNGYHRAYALRALGLTHAPCVIQDVTRLDELKLRAAQRVTDDPAFYFRAKRPPLFKDFFDPRIAKTFPLRPRRKVVEVSFTVRKSYHLE